MTAVAERLRILHVSETYGDGVETPVRQFIGQQAAGGRAPHLLGRPGEVDVPIVDQPHACGARASSGVARRGEKAA